MKGKEEKPEVQECGAQGPLAQLREHPEKLDKSTGAMPRPPRSESEYTAVISNTLPS